MTDNNYYEWSEQLTRKIPQRHADDDLLELPDDADRDMVRES